MELIKGIHLGPMMMMPAKKGTCPECSVEHPEEMPHDKTSMFYQYKFYNENGRWPTWKDAIEHCRDDVKEIWTKELKRMGIEIE